MANSIYDALMARDGLTRAEAKAQVASVRAEMEEAICSGDYALAEDIMYSDLGLEMDYLVDMLI